MPTLRKIVVRDFRNIALQELSFSPNVNCISGNNGEGKTNLLDAIYYLSMTKSAFPGPDRLNFRYGSEGFALGGTYAMENGTKSLISITVSDKEKKLARDGKQVTRMADHIGLLPVVMVSPGDIVLVSEGGEDRRRLINSVLSQMDREYLAAAQAYNRLLAQRNKILKEDSPSMELLEVLDLKMEPLAEKIVSERRGFTTRLQPVVAEYYHLISGGGESVSIQYRADSGHTPLSQLFASRRDRDLALRFTTSGPQRDDFLFLMDGHPIRHAGSQGQQKSFLVALKFAQYNIMTASYGFPPILLLDDVFDKLDLGRISNLIGMVAGSDFGQIFITDTDSSRLSGIVDRITEDRAYFDTVKGEFHARA
ncbi:MAG: DNA replication and repair protein RecF [Bacteroidales bacterium]|nr:DNA replication and repair protein RecF [Bacteroidales bacterium]